jgi:hypothetical protein
MPAPPTHTCPRCRAETGRPDRIAHEDTNEVRIVLKCDACRHRWSAMIPNDESWPEVRHQLLHQSAWRFES